jgi:hypothetical protein
MKFLTTLAKKNFLNATARGSNAKNTAGNNQQSEKINIARTLLLTELFRGL